MSKTYNIQVSLVNGVITMSNNGNVTCNSGDTIQWNPDSTIAQIDSIVDNSSVNVLSSGPGPVAESKNWKGIVKTVTQLTEESYTINVTAASTSDKVTVDPRISVNP